MGIGCIYINIVILEKSRHISLQKIHFNQSNLYQALTRPGQ